MRSASEAPEVGEVGEPYPVTRLLERDVVVDAAVVLSAMGITAWFIGAAVAATWWVPAGLAMLVLVAEVYGLAHVDRLARSNPA